MQYVIKNWFEELPSSSKYMKGRIKPLIKIGSKVSIKANPEGERAARVIWRDIDYAVIDVVHSGERIRISIAAIRLAKSGDQTDEVKARMKATADATRQQTRERKKAEIQSRGQLLRQKRIFEEQNEEK